MAKKKSVSSFEPDAQNAPLFPVNQWVAHDSAEIFRNKARQPQCYDKPSTSRLEYPDLLLNSICVGWMVFWSKTNM